MFGTASDTVCWMSHPVCGNLQAIGDYISLMSVTNPAAIGAAALVPVWCSVQPLTPCVAWAIQSLVTLGRGCNFFIFCCFPLKCKSPYSLYLAHSALSFFKSALKMISKIAFQLAHSENDICRPQKSYHGLVLLSESRLMQFKVMIN